LSEEPTISDETLIAALEGRGFEVSRKDKPLSEDRIRQLVRKELDEAASPAKEQQSEPSFAENYARALDRSRSRRFGEEDPPDAA
jgi:hypothetical protein